MKTRSQVGPLGPKWQRGGVDAGAGVHAGVGVHAGAGVHEHELMRARCIHVMTSQSDALPQIHHVWKSQRAPIRRALMAEVSKAQMARHP